jgi:hypothetical protein
MAIKTVNEYRDRISKLKQRLFIGGIAVTLPSELELENTEIGKYISKYLKSAASIKKEDADGKVSSELGCRIAWCGYVSGSRSKSKPNTDPLPDMRFRRKKENGRGIGFHV